MQLGAYALHTGTFNTLAAPYYLGGKGGLRRIFSFDFPPADVYMLSFLK